MISADNVKTYFIMRNSKSGYKIDCSNLVRGRLSPGVRVLKRPFRQCSKSRLHGQKLPRNIINIMEEKMGKDEKGKIKQDIHNLVEKNSWNAKKYSKEQARVGYRASFPSITGKVS